MATADRRQLAARREYPRALQADVLTYGTEVDVLVAMGPGTQRRIRIAVRDLLFWLDRR